MVRASNCDIEARISRRQQAKLAGQCLRYDSGRAPTGGRRAIVTGDGYNQFVFSVSVGFRSPSMGSERGKRA
jgi:hypothetical protein